MYKVIVCDDEKEILKSIQISVKESLENDEVIAEYECIDDARILMETLKEQKIDVLFLDIDMPYFSGMDIAGYINENHLDIILVFVTSHDALVYKTFTYRPFGFIRKSYFNQEIDEIALRIKEELNSRKQELLIQKGQEITRVLLGDILYIEADGNYLKIILKDSELKIRETMTNIENELLGKGFIRCHKGYLVNSQYVKKLKSGEIEISQESNIITIPVGRSYEKDVRGRIFELIRN